MSDDNNAHLPLTRRQILGSLSVAGTAGALGGTATSALFTDEEAISNNQLVAGTLDMKVSWEEHYSDWSPDERQAAPGARIETNSSRLDRANETGLPTQNNPLRSVPDTNITAFMNATRQERSPTGGLSSGADPCSALSDTTQQPAVITLSDVKPGDFGEVTFDFALCDNPGFVWMIGNLVSKAENGTTEPEAASSAEGSGVELLDAARAAVWVDDGDNYQDDQSDDNGPETIVKSGSLRDVLAALSSNNGVTLSGDIPASQGGGTGVNCFSATSVHYVGFAWWVPLDIGNQVQSDSVEFNLGFYTEQCRHNTVRGAEEPDTEPTAPVQNVDTGETFDALTAAVSAATPGQELSARGGETFAEDLTLDVQDLTVRGDDDPHPVIEGSVSIQANDSSLRGFEVIDGGVTVQEGSVGVSVEDSTVRGSGTGTAGIVVEGGQDTLLLGNVVTGFDDGIVVDGVTGSGVELSLNTVKENGVGIRVTTSVSDILDAVQIGTAAGRDPSFNTIANNETGVRIEDEIGTVATDVQTIRLVPANAFDRNDKNILPEPGTPPVDRSPSVTTVPDGATIHVPDAATGPVRADLPDVTLGDGISVQSITASLAPASGRTITLDTSVSGGGEPLPLGSGLADYFSLTATPSGVVSDATLTISVAKDQVADPDRFSVWRFTNGEWATLPTERLGTTSERFFYQVRTPGFSTFAATEVPDDPTTHSPFLARLPDTIVAGSIEVFGSGAEAVERSVAADFVDSGGEPLVFDFSSLSLSDGATAEDVLQFTNTGDSAAWVRMTSAATGVAFTRPSGIPGIEVDMSLPFQLGSDASVDVDASREPIEPDDQLWARLVVPALAEEQGDGQELVLGNEVGLQSENVDAEYVNSIPEASFEDLVPVCTNDRPAPVMLAKDYAAPGETPDWVPQVDFGPGASLPRNGVSHNRVEARIRVEQSSDIEQDLIIGIPQAAPSMDSASSGVGRMISVYDPEENIFERDDNDDDHFPLTEPWASDNPDKIGIPIGAEDLAEGPVEKRVDLIFETVSPCDQPINDVVFDYVQNLGLTVQFDSDSDSDRTWQDVAGTTSTTATMDIYSTGASLAQQAQNVADKAMNIFAERVIAAAFPSPVQMYGAALRAVSAPAGALVPAAIGIANNLDSLLTDTPLTPDNILQAAIVQGIVEYEAPPGTESVPSWLQAAADEVAGIGPTVYVSGDPPDPKGAVAGTVVTDDGSSSTPIEGVTVESQTTGQTVTTNEDGVFALTLPPGEDTLQFQPPEESDPPFGSEEVSVTVDAGEVQDGVTVTLEAQSETGFTDDFDYPTSELAANEWTVVNGTFETSDSFLLGDAGFEPNRVRIYREQARASGTFEFRGVRNQAAFFGLRIDFVSNGTTVEDNTAGYRLQFRQRQQGDVLFRRIGEEGPETLLTIDENHGGNPHDVRIDRDPETFAFTIYYDGEEVGTVEDDTVTESTYWTMAYGGDLGTQRIDRVEASEKAELEYTLTVTDASGTAVGSVSVEDTFDASEYGEHVAFSTVGDTQFDNDRGIIDHVRLESGEVIEDWEVRGLDDYTRTATGGGDFEIVESPTANGQRALTLFSGCCGDTITSNDELLSELEAGTTVRAEVRHQTDNSITFAHTTGLKLGTDADGNGGIDARLINPGSQRIAGARLRTPNADGRIEFEPNLQEFYTFTIEIGD